MFLLLKTLKFKFFDPTSIIASKLQLKRIIYFCNSETHFLEWKCFYNTSIDGISQNTMFNNLNIIQSEEINRFLIIIGDINGYCFGSYIDGACFNKLKSFNHYQGSIDSFVFHFGGKYTKRNKKLMSQTFR